MHVLEVDSTMYMYYMYMHCALTFWEIVGGRLPLLKYVTVGI